MNYNCSCETYCEKSAELTDPVVFAGNAKSELETDIKNLRAKRWEFATLNIDKSGKPVIKIVDESIFEASCKEEADKLKSLASYIQMFNNLNIIFEEVQKKYPRLKAPTLAGLQDLRHDYNDDVRIYMGRVKTDLANRLIGYRTTGKTADDITTDPAFLAKKREYDGIIEQTQLKVTEINNYISHVKKIVGE
jgi:hypothetical protein